MATTEEDAAVYESAQEAFQPMDEGPAPAGKHPHSRGKPETSSRDLAEAAASEAVGAGEEPSPKGASTASPGDARFQGYEDVEHAQEGTMEETPPEGEPAPTERTETSPQEEPSSSPTPVLGEPDLQRLSDLGIELDPAEVPDEAQEELVGLARTTVELDEALQDREERLAETMQQLQGFSERLQENPRRVLLGMALNDPETFSDVMDEFTRMQENEEYAESVRKDLAATTKMEAAERKEQAVEAARSNRKARRIKNTTDRIAQKYGVDSEDAREMVADRLYRKRAARAEGHDIPVDMGAQEIDELLSRVAGGPARRPRPEAKSPETQKAEETAPTQPAEEGQPASGQTEEGVGPATGAQGGGESGHVMDRLRGAIRQSARRNT